MARSDVQPVVLVHGIARFDWLWEHYRSIFDRDGNAGTDHNHYFRNIRSHLTAHGFEVYHASLSYAQRSEQRTLELAAQIENILEQSGARHVHLLGHSMGGLDARRLIINRPDLACRIASLTTIGTPHLGTSLADWGLQHGGQHLIGLANPLLDLSGFKDLTPKACAEFNRLAEPFEATNAVRYRVCASHAQREDTLLLLRPSWDVVYEQEGENDGMVSVRSQLWTTHLRCNDGRCKPVEQIRFPCVADHFNQTGWWDPSKRNRDKSLAEVRVSIDEFEAGVKQVYLGLVQGLKVDLCMKPGNDETP